MSYLLILCLTGWGTFFLESQSEKALLILMQLTFLAVPLVSMVFTTIYFYNASEFIMLILSQPITRSTVINSLYCGLVSSFVLCFIIGIGVPLLIFHPTIESFTVMYSGVLLTLTFTALSLYMSILVNEKTRGMGLTLILWVFYAFIYDGLLLFFMYQFGDYPIEKAVLALSFLNPIDIARILVIMKTEASALLGLSGAVFRNFFGTSTGLVVSILILLIWVMVPFYMAHRQFQNKDL